MSHIDPGRAGFAAPRPMLTRSTPCLDVRQLRGGIADRRRRLLDLELAMVAACEAQAARGRTPGVQMHDRETWDQATWQRYIAAAADVEHEFGPPMRQLYREIDQLERILALPSVTGAAA